jgi:hypothetical protein
MGKVLLGKYGVIVKIGLAVELNEGCAPVFGDAGGVGVENMYGLTKSLCE